MHQKLLGYHELAFYLWAVSLAIVTAQTLYSLLNDPADGFTEIMIAVGALVACEKMGIVGNNGTGKSTFIKILMGEQKPDSGTLDIGETYKTTHIKYANMKNSLSFVCLKNINNYKIEY